ncbi:MAG: rRNA maturation RNase YbeY [Acidobacteriota bacterium]|nr:rRNA maturation RNase YbeY [Acidobacteriota bacterium]
MSPSDPAGRRGLQVLVADESGRRPVGRALTDWLASVAPARLRGRVTVAVVGDARVRALNRRYRGIDKVTDVLSFPARDDRGRAGGDWPEPAGARPELGDIVIAAGVAERQARAAGHSRLTELRVLALHGLLHLAGYDHERDDGAMARLERRLRRKGGLREGLIERSA